MRALRPYPAVVYSTSMSVFAAVDPALWNFSPTAMSEERCGLEAVRGKLEGGLAAFHDQQSPGALGENGRARSRWTQWPRALSTCSSHTSLRHVQLWHCNGHCTGHCICLIHLAPVSSVLFLQANIEQLRKNFAFTCPILDMGFVRALRVEQVVESFMRLSAEQVLQVLQRFSSLLLKVQTVTCLLDALLMTVVGGAEPSQEAREPDAGTRSAGPLGKDGEGL